MHLAVVLVSPAGIREDALHGEIHFHRGLLRTHCPRQPPGNLVAALDHVFRKVVENLRAIVRRALGPARCIARSFNRVANILAIAQRRLAQQLALAPVHREGISRIGPRLFAADVLLHRAIDRRSGRRTRRRKSLFLIRRFQFRRLLRRRGQRVQPLRRQVFQHALAPAFAPVPGFAIAAKPARRVELVGRVHPHHARLHLRCQVQRHVDVLAPNARGQPVHGIVRQLRSLGRSAEGHRHQHRPENFFLHHGRRRMHIRQQRRRIEAALFRHCMTRLPALRAFRHACVHHLANRLQLHRRNNRPNVDRFIQRRTHAQRFHARANFGVECFGHALLHQQPRTRAAHLPLVEPDRVDQPFNRRVQIRIVEDHERRFPAQLQ